MNIPLPVASATALGLELRRARRYRKMTQRDLAKAANVDLATVANLERGCGTVGPLVAILAALEHSLSGQDRDLSLGQWLGRVRRGMRFSQNRLSMIADLSKPTVIQIEHDRGHLHSFLAIMGALGVPLSLIPNEQEAGWSALSHVRVHVGDCMDVLPQMPAKRFHACITSPPYFQQRCYGAEKQIGLEATAEEYITRLVAALREVRRVLRGDGTLWLVLGDAFARNNTGSNGRRRKELLGIPWRVALALQEDGWFLRQDIILSKANSLPEPVRDRFVRAHEYLFLLSKGPRYYFDAHAVREPGVTTNPGSRQRDTRETHGHLSGGNGGLNSAKERLRREIEELGFVTRNKRSVWPISTQPTRESHFGTFSEALVEPCVLAGCPVGGLVLDPFAGSGTTGVVARRMNRGAELIELNPKYAEIARRRCSLPP